MTHTHYTHGSDIRDVLKRLAKSFEEKVTAIIESVKDDKEKLPEPRAYPSKF